MTRREYEQLSRRERQIMDVVYRCGEASVAVVRGEMDDAPSYSAVRATMGILVKKGCLEHRKDGARYLYRAVQSRRRVRKGALGRLVDTFFDGSPEKTLAALLSSEELDDAELARMQRMIDDARRSGR